MTTDSIQLYDLPYQKAPEHLLRGLGTVWSASCHNHVLTLYKLLCLVYKEVGEGLGTGMKVVVVELRDA